jgi:ectoine hydroxylase-related dioxygenase (phytanoyl-CoA dioxygenase family)
MSFETDRDDYSGNLLASNSLLGSPERLRRRAYENGYLFLKGLLDPAELSHARRQVMQVLNQAGLVDAKQETVKHSVFDAMARDDFVEGIPGAVYAELLRIEALYRLPHRKSLAHVWQSLCGSDALVHPRHIVRTVLPSPSTFPTPPHQDNALVQGTSQTWTCWIPLGDVPTKLGGLVLWPKSHRLGRLPMTTLAGTSFGIGVEVEDQQPVWLGADYKLGDVLIFHSLTVHRALPSGDADRVRVSLDCRAQPAAEPIQPNSLRPHISSMSWEEIYKGWSTTTPQYYWRGKQLQFAPFDSSVFPDSVRKTKFCEDAERQANDTSGLL